VSVVNSFNERLTHTFSDTQNLKLTVTVRVSVAVVITAAALFIAEKVGFVGLVANGYRWISYTIIAIFALPLLTLGVWFLWQNRHKVE
jgi:uncharacterized membrane protein YkvI